MEVFTKCYVMKMQSNKPKHEMRALTNRSDIQSSLDWTLEFSQPYPHWFSLNWQFFCIKWFHTFIFILHLHPFLHYVSNISWELNFDLMALSEHENKTCRNATDLPSDAVHLHTWLRKPYNGQVLPGKLSTHTRRRSCPLRSSTAAILPGLQTSWTSVSKTMDEWAFNVAVVFWQLETYRRSDWWCAPSRASCWQVWPARH